MIMVKIIFLYLTIGHCCGMDFHTSDLYDLFLNRTRSGYSSVNSVNQTVLQEIIDVHQASSVHSHGKVNRLNKSECLNSLMKDTKSPDCLKSVCLTASDLFNLLDISSDSYLTASQFHEVLTYVILSSPNKHLCDDHQKLSSHKPTASEIWGYGFVCVTVINLCALVGLIFLPLMRKRFYQSLLMFMVALAVGTLMGSSILFLMPEAFELMSEESHVSKDYIWRASTVIGGIYLFFLTERLLKLLTRKSAHGESVKVIGGSLRTSRPPGTGQSMNMTFEVPSERKISESQLTAQGLLSSANSGKAGPEEVEEASQFRRIESVAWMIIFGDGLHNFIDGLSIGAAFSKNLLSGFSVSVAVLCEELPHELGDFAILLNSGMSMWQALGYNFLSACMCYVGLVIGIVVGELTHGQVWIFALAAGMFLYISLVDMLPEMNSVAEKFQMSAKSSYWVFLLQNVGLLTGFIIMLALANFGDLISNV